MSAARNKLRALALSFETDAAELAAKADRKRAAAGTMRSFADGRSEEECNAMLRVIEETKPS